MPRDAEPNLALYNLREARAETQEQVAAGLNAIGVRRGEATAITGNHVSRWERGIVRPSPLHRQLLAEYYGVTVAELGLVRQRIVPPGHNAHISGPMGSGVLAIEDDLIEDSHVAESQQKWLHVRKQMPGRYLDLARAAAKLYPEDVRIGDGLISRPDWKVTPPLDLDNIELTFDPHAGPPALDGAEEEAAHLRPMRDQNRRYQRYSHAIRDVARPKLFENRPSWRLIDAEFSAGRGHLSFGDMNYFDGIDICETVAHETAATHVINDGSVVSQGWRGLRFRRAIGDPFDLRRRAMLLSINTLTIRLDSTGASVVLHSRSAASVATAGGVIGVMPAGVFQPSTVRVSDHKADFNLWHNIMREYSEEFLGNPEHAGDGPGADYETEPFRSLDRARKQGRIRVFCFGLGISALDLWGAIETVAVFDAEVFDEIFAELVRFNDEGSVLRVGSLRPTSLIPLTREVIDELWATGRLSPEAAYSLRAAWEHRDLILAKR